MKNIKKVYKVMLRHWGYALGALILMQGFALFSSVSLVMAMPLFDYVFKSDPALIKLTTFSQFSEQFQAVTSQALSQNLGLIEFFSEANRDLLKEFYTGLLAQTDPVLLLWIISVTMLLMIILKNIFFYLNKAVMINLRGKTVFDLRTQMYSKYITQSLSFYSRNKVGDSLVRIITDARFVNNFFIKSMFMVVQNIILLTWFIATALILNSRLFVISLIIFPVFSIILGFVGKKIKKYSKRIQAQTSILFSNIEEKLNNMRIVKAFAREDYEMEKFISINTKFFKSWRKSRLYRAVNVPLSEFNGTIMGIIVLLVGGQQVLTSESFTLGAFTAFLMAIFSMLHPIKKLTNAYAEIKKAQVSLDRIYEIIDQEVLIKESENPVAKPCFQKEIVIKDACFSYDGEKEVLKKLNFSIKKGEQVALVGSSGSGKTTFVNLLARMYDLTDGDILVDGIPYRDIALKDLRTLFGTVTQESILFSDTIFKNIRYGSLDEIDETQVKEAARIAYADEFIDKLPNGYSELLHPKASNLSGGQKQRICIARAIVGNPPILIFDEATSALDTESEQKVQKAIEQATKDRTVVVIAHRLSTILNSDKIIVFDDGKIVGNGSHAELLETCPRYQTLYNIQFNEA